MGTRSLLLACLAATAAIILLCGTTAGTTRIPRAPRDGHAPGTQAAVLPAETEPVADAAAVSADPRVVDDATGTPVAGARVTLYQRCRVPRTALETDTYVTDEQGRFAWIRRPVDDWLVVRAEGYPPATFYVSEIEPELRLSRGETRTLTIVDEDGNPGAYAQVEVHGDYGHMLRLYTECADARGLVTLRLTGGECILVRVRGYAVGSVTDSARVVLEPSFSIGGRVVDSTGAALGRAVVRISQGGG